MQQNTVSLMLGKQGPMPGTPSVTLYYDPKRDGDLKARIKAVAEKRGGPYPGPYKESDWTRRLLLAMLDQEERDLGLKPGAKRRKTA
jgi:hypothetical protein